MRILPNRFPWLVFVLILFSIEVSLFSQSRNKTSERPTAPPQAPIRFRNEAESAGLKLVLENNPTPEKHMIETMPGGVAVFDYNND